MTTNFNVPPDAVKVWRGYRASSAALIGVPIVDSCGSPEGDL